MTIYLGTYNYSSWSLRAWLALKLTGVEFDEVVIALDQPDTQQKILQFSPSGKVPVLKHDDLYIWDSLAIFEYLAELFPQAMLWPTNYKTRAIARSICAEMHSNFFSLRNYLPMDIKNSFSNFFIPDEAGHDIYRILAIWEMCRNNYGKTGKYLFGDFTIADAMYAPVATRFISYNVKLPHFAKEYVKNIIEHPAMLEWSNKIT